MTGPKATNGFTFKPAHLRSSGPSKHVRTQARWEEQAFFFFLPSFPISTAAMDEGDTSAARNYDGRRRLRGLSRPDALPMAMAASTYRREAEKVT